MRLPRLLSFFVYNNFDMFFSSLISVSIFGFVAMEESLCRDNHRNQPSCGELEVPSRWFSFSGFLYHNFDQIYMKCYIELYFVFMVTLLWKRMEMFFCVVFLCFDIKVVIKVVFTFGCRTLLERYKKFFIFSHFNWQLLRFFTFYIRNKVFQIFIILIL